jgi:hypothetical protein
VRLRIVALAIVVWSYGADGASHLESAAHAARESRACVHRVQSSGRRAAYYPYALERIHQTTDTGVLASRLRGYFERLFAASSASFSTVRAPLKLFIKP